jgi:hypothetical protein
VFLLGIITAFSGQLHLSGFYYGIGLFMTAIIAKQFNRRQIILFSVGFILGMLTALPWLSAIIRDHESHFSFINIVKFEFLIHSLIDPLGINVNYSLGPDTWQFLQFKNGAGFKLYLPAFSALFIFILFIIAVIKIFFAKKITKTIFTFESPVYFNLLAFVLIPGTLLTLSGIPIRSHYLIGALPFLHVFLLYILSILKQKYQLVFITLQACITFMFLNFIHRKQMIKGDYGETYREQVMVK